MRIIRLSLSPPRLALTAAGPSAQSDGFLPLTPMDRIEIQHLIARYATRSIPVDATATTTPICSRRRSIRRDESGATGRFVSRPRHAGVAGARRLTQSELREPLHHQRRAADHADGAKGTEYAIIGDFGANGSTDGKWTHGGRYEDTYVKTPDGWRFKTRVFYASEGGAIRSS
jgi:hypothetical protein